MSLFFPNRRARRAKEREKRPDDTPMTKPSLAQRRAKRDRRSRSR